MKSIGYGGRRGRQRVGVAARLIQRQAVQARHTPVKIPHSLVSLPSHPAPVTGSIGRGMMGHMISIGRGGRQGWQRVGAAYSQRQVFENNLLCSPEITILSVAKITIGKK